MSKLNNIILIKQLPVGETFPINEKLAGLVPMAIPQEQEALTISIKERGLDVPVVLYKGAIVDGRCRQLACTIAGVPVKATDLDDELSEEEVALWVKVANTRRNLTVAQKIMIASKESRKEGSKSITVIAKAWGVSRAIVTMANYVAKKRPDFVEPIFNGLTVEIVNDKGKTIKTNKISAIHAFIKREEANNDIKIEYDWKAEDVITTQKGLSWFFDFIKETKTNNLAVMMELAERANDKFKDV